MKAIEDLYRQYRSAVYLRLYGMVRQHELAEDLTHDTFMAAWQALPRLRSDSHIYAWLIAIARHKALHALDRQQTRIKHGACSLEALWECNEDTFDIEDRRLMPVDKLLADNETRARVIARLPLSSQETIVRLARDEDVEGKQKWYARTMYFKALHRMEAEEARREKCHMGKCALSMRHCAQRACERQSMSHYD